MQEETVKKFEAKTPRIDYLFSVMPDSRRWELVESDHRFQQAWAIYYEASHIVDILNIRVHNWILPTQPAQEANLLELYRRLRQERFYRMHRVLIDFVQSGEAFNNPNFIENHFRLWCQSKREIAARREQYLAQVNDSLRPYFDDAHSCLADTVQLEVFLDGLFDDLRAGHLHLEPVEEVGEVVQWSEKQLECLEKELGPPRSILINIAEFETGDEKPLLESQLTSNKCANCKKTYIKPCEVKDCHHVFCFSCIVPWIHARYRCPTCRGKAVTGDLVLLDVTKEEAIDGDASDQEKIQTNDPEGDADEAELEAMLKNLAMTAKSAKELIELAKGKKAGGTESKETESSKD